MAKQFELNFANQIDKVVNSTNQGIVTLNALIREDVSHLMTSKTLVEEFNSGKSLQWYWQRASLYKEKAGTISVFGR